MAEKQHEATPRKLAQARRDGQVWRANLLVQAIGFATFVGIVWFTKTSVMEVLHNLVELCVSVEWSGNLDQLLGVALLISVVPVVVLLGTSALGAWIVGASLGGLVLSTKPITLNPTKLDPVAGSQKLIRSITRDGWQLLVRFLLSSVVLMNILFSSTTQHAPMDAVMRVLLVGAALLLLLGVGDGWLKRRAFMKDQRMSDEEVRREHKDIEGDPYIKAAQRAAFESLSRPEMMKRLRNASVLVVRKRSEGPDSETVGEAV